MFHVIRRILTLHLQWKEFIICNYGESTSWLWKHSEPWCTYIVMQPERVQGTGNVVCVDLSYITFHVWNHFFHFMQFVAFKMHKQFEQAFTKAGGKLIWGIDGKYNLTSPQALNLFHEDFPGDDGGWPWGTKLNWSSLCCRTDPMFRVLKQLCSI